MSLPQFTAAASLYRSRGYYRHGQPANSPAGAVVPAIPACRNCDYILDNCEQNGWRPRAVCNACAIGYCYEDPPPIDPFPNPFPDPWTW